MDCSLPGSSIHGISQARVLEWGVTTFTAMDSSQPVFSVHGIPQARILEWVAVSFSSESSWPKDWTCVSCIAGRFFKIWATREVRKPSPYSQRFWHNCSGEEARHRYLLNSLEYSKTLPGLRCTALSCCYSFPACSLQFPIFWLKSHYR